MEMLFGDIWTILSTLCLLIMIGYILININAVKTGVPVKWRNKILILAAIGLLLCIFVVMRDRYVDSIQGGTGLFPLESIQIALAYIGAGVIAFIILSSLFIRNQKYHKFMFFILSAVMVCKAIVIEVSRWLM